jgi:hypothetical protein
MFFNITYTIQFVISAFQFEAATAFPKHPNGEITDYAYLCLAGAVPAEYFVSCGSDQVGRIAPVGRRAVPNYKLSGYIFGDGLRRQCPAKKKSS